MPHCRRAIRSVAQPAGVVFGIASRRRSETEETGSAYRSWCRRGAPAVISRQSHLSLVDLLKTSVEKHGSRPLFVTKSGDHLWDETTYNQFANLVDRLRGGLASLGVVANDRVGIIANNSIEWAVVAYATYGLGATLVPMYESQLPKERTFITADSGIK